MKGRKRYYKYLTALMIMLLSFSLRAEDDFCGIRNSAIKDGEVITMKVFYSTLGMYIGAGEATFSTTFEKYNGKPSFHCVGEGKTYSFFDNFFKVRDRYETYIDTNNMLPMKFIRNVQEGDTKIYNNVTFNQKTATAVSTKGVYKVTPCIQDVISAVYYARNINFDKYKPGDKIPYDMFLDDEIYHLHISYLGKETIKTKYGKFHAIKFKPLLIKGTMFQGGENMTVWVGDDPNHVVLRVESPISVGSVKVDMMGYKNLRYPMTSLISFR
jgi:hypothetical protein